MDIENIKAALKPFAESAGCNPLHYGKLGDDEAANAIFSLGDLRRAAEAYATLERNDDIPQAGSMFEGSAQTPPRSKPLIEGGSVAIYRAVPASVQEQKT